MSSSGPPGPDASPPATTDRRRPSLWIIGAITVTGILSNTLINAAIPDILDDFDRPSSAAGLVVAAASVPGIVVAPIIGLLADRYGRRTVLVPCLVAFGVFGGLGGLAPSYWVLVAARFLQGFGSAGLINLANILIGDNWEGVDRARVFGYNSAILTVFLAVLPGVGGFLAGLGSWRYAFAPYPLAILTALVAWRRLARGSVDRSVSVSDQLRAAGRVVRAPAVLGPIGLSLLTFVFVFGLVLTILPIHLEEEFGLAASTRGLVIAVPAVGATVGALVLGRLRERLAPPVIAAAAFGLFAVAYPIIGLAGALVVLLVATVLYGLGQGLILPTLTDIVAESAPEASRGAVLSAQVSAIRLGQSLGPLIGGAGIAALGTGTSFVVGGAAAAGLCLVTALSRRGAQ